VPEGSGGGECPAPPRGGRSDARQVDSERGRLGKLLSPARRRACIEHVRATLMLSERRVCRVLGQVKNRAWVITPGTTPRRDPDTHRQLVPLGKLHDHAESPAARDDRGLVGWIGGDR
jgi:hypothetical protein